MAGVMEIKMQKTQKSISSKKNFENLKLNLKIVKNVCK